MADLKALLEAGDGRFPAYAWPGAYPMIYYTQDGGMVCASCANDFATSDPVIDADTYDEGPTVLCDDCRKPIESSYGDPAPGSRGLG